MSLLALHFAFGSYFESFILFLYIPLKKQQRLEEVNKTTLKACAPPERQSISGSRSLFVTTPEQASSRAAAVRGKPAVVVIPSSEAQFLTFPAVVPTAFHNLFPL